MSLKIKNSEGVDRITLMGPSRWLWGNRRSVKVKSFGATYGHHSLHQNTKILGCYLLTFLVHKIYPWLLKTTKLVRILLLAKKTFWEKDISFLIVLGTHMSNWFATKQKIEIYFFGLSRVFKSGRISKENLRWLLQGDRKRLNMTKIKTTTNFQMMILDICVA